MPHSIVHLAKEVIFNKCYYSECVVSYANSIVNWSDDRRIKILKLYTNYREVYRAHVIACHNLPRIERIYATNRVLNSAINKTIHNDYHLCKNAMKNKNDMNYFFLLFQAMVDLSSTADVNEMYKYMTCVNAKRHDESLDSKIASFMRAVPRSEMVEIVLFKLAKQSTHKTF